MDWFRDFRLVLFKPLELMEKYRTTPTWMLATVLAGAAILADAVAAPLAAMIFGSNGYPPSNPAGEIAVKLAAGAVTFLLSCLVFRLLALIFSKPASFKLIAATWGTSYLPTFLCVLVVEASEAGFYAFIGNVWLGFLLCAFLVLLLALKAIYFFIELNIVLGLKGKQVIWAVVITGAFYLLFMMAGFRLGLKVPML